MISPKAVIDHLQMLEEARILSFRNDERRRKYYYLEHDITIQVNLDLRNHGLIPVILSSDQRFLLSLQKLRQMIKSRDETVEKLEIMEHDIDHQLNEVLREGKIDGADDKTLLVSVAVAHGAKNMEEISDITALSEPVVESVIKKLTEVGIVLNNGVDLEIRGIYAE